MTEITYWMFASAIVAVVIGSIMAMARCCRQVGLWMLLAGTGWDACLGQFIDRDKFVGPDIFAWRQFESVWLAPQMAHKD